MGDVTLESGVAATVTRHKLTVDDLYRMVAAGILDKDDRVELIDGELIDMAPIGPLHQGTVDYLNRVFTRALSTNIVRVQGPIVISQRTQLQPDLSVLRERKDFYRQSLARPEDCLLVIEVADTTVRLDREGKIPIYSKAGIPEAWLIDLENRELVVYTAPTSDGYGNSMRPDPGHRVSPLLLPEVSLAVADLFVV
jgi:hypothetical protein